MKTAKRHLGGAYAPKLTAAFFAVFLLFSAYIPYTPASAEAAAADVSRAFTSTETLAGGTIVSLVGTSGDAVEPANSTNTKQLVGVVVAKDGSLISIDSNQNSVQVATSGKANVLVSNLNGDIKTGDLIAESPISGVGTVALAGEKVIGVAQADFSAISPNTSAQTVTDTSGKQKQVAIGSIPLIVAVGTAAGNSDGQYGTGLKGMLSDVAGKPVSSSRIIMTGFISLLALGALAAMIFAAVKNGIAGTSRNPLAKPVIFESLAQVFVMIILVSVVSLVINYAILRL